jgi:hypothetical protein
LAASTTVGSTDAVALGDDCNEWNASTEAELTLLYKERCGLTLRDVDTTTKDKFEFCSREYIRTENGWKSSLTTWPKAFHRICVLNSCTTDAFQGVWSEMVDNSTRSKIGVLLALQAKTSRLLKQLK